MPLQLGVDPETNRDVVLPDDVLLRHVVILGSTGAGKTVLAKAFLEEAVRGGTPVIAVDPQGDLPSLAVRRGPEASEEHPPPPDVVEEYWSKAAVSILTPGSTRGTVVGLNPLRRPPGAGTSEDFVLGLDALAESLAAAMGYDPAPDVGVRVKDVLFLTLQITFKQGRWPRDLSDLVQLLRDDPSPEAARLLTNRERAAMVRRAESMTIGAKGLLFTAGPPLDVEAMLAPPRKGRVPINVVYTGGLRSSRERDLVVATLCKDVLAWMTARPSGALRLVLYIDEVAGLCPPHPRNPPTKKFLALLFRQARKFGVGVIVATQNVTDLDYKALGQASTWALGRLMARQDLDRVRHVIASVNGGSHEAVLTAVPSLRAGEFILLSPDHLSSAQRLAVRGLATRHEVVPEERFREVQAAAILAETTPRAGDPNAHRRRAAAAATREAKSTVPAEVEEGLGFRVLSLFDDMPGFCSEEEIRSRLAVNGPFLTVLLMKLVERRLLVAERVSDRDVYWDPAAGFDPRRGGAKEFGLWLLAFPLVRATKRARDHLRRRLLIPQERLARKGFYYLPLWRVVAEVPNGRSPGPAMGEFYVHAVTGAIAERSSGRLSFEDIPRKDATRLDSVAPTSRLDRVPMDRVSAAIPLAKVGPAQAREIVRTSYGAQPAASDPEVVLLPIWRFDLASKASGQTRSLWVDGAFGTVFREAP